MELEVVVVAKAIRPPPVGLAGEAKLMRIDFPGEVGGWTWK
jgi:hypothetical protein